jgi:hypothetical protein
MGHMGHHPQEQHRHEISYSELQFVLFRQLLHQRFMRALTSNSVTCDTARNPTWISKLSQSDPYCSETFVFLIPEPNKGFLFSPIYLNTWRTTKGRRSGWMDSRSFNNSLSIAAVFQRQLCKTIIAIGEHEKGLGRKQSWPMSTYNPGIRLERLMGARVVRTAAEIWARNLPDTGQKCYRFNHIIGISCWTLSIVWGIVIYTTFRELALLPSSGYYTDIFIPFLILLVTTVAIVPGVFLILKLQRKPLHHWGGTSLVFRRSLVRSQTLSLIIISQW